MPWLWTDTLAALLLEHDRVPEDRVSEWLLRPVALRLPDGGDPLSLARALLSPGDDLAAKRGAVSGSG